MCIVCCGRHRLFSRCKFSWFHSWFDFGWIHRHEDRYSTVFFLSLLDINWNPSMVFPIARCVNSYSLENKGKGKTELKNSQRVWAIICICIFSSCKWRFNFQVKLSESEEIKCESPNFFNVFFSYILAVLLRNRK